jgi:hypothetical protein
MTNIKQNEPLFVIQHPSFMSFSHQPLILNAFHLKIENCSVRKTKISTKMKGKKNPHHTSLVSKVHFYGFITHPPSNDDQHMSLRREAAASESRSETDIPAKTTS